MLPFEISAAINISSQPLLDEDAELAAVYHRLRKLDPTGIRFATVLRNTIDQLLNGEATGRYEWKKLFKTEKTHAGTMVEINLQREFKFDDGDHMDYKIDGIDVDCKYSQSDGGWMIPPEALGHLCLLVWADDYKSKWSVGLLRINRQWLNGGNNRDLKLTIKAAHRDRILWLYREAELPKNILLHMSPIDRTAVFSHTSGQARVNELFRRAQGQQISRNVIRTVAQQKDYMKRVRGNGGARSALQRDGIIIMGDYESHRRIARSLGLPAPREGEFVSAQVRGLTDGESSKDSVPLDGKLWTLASPGDAPELAPQLPSHKR